jgi:hypothetical protein
MKTALINDRMYFSADAMQCYTEVQKSQPIYNTDLSYIEYHIAQEKTENDKLIAKYRAL